MKKLAIIIFVTFSFIGVSQGEEPEWKNDFFLGLWEGCMEKTINANIDYIEIEWSSVKELFESNDPVVTQVRDACNCQTSSFQDNYSRDELASILALPPSDKKYIDAISQVNSKCR